MTALLERLCQAQPASYEESFNFFTRTVSGAVDAVELAAVLTAMRCNGESADEVHGAARALLSTAEYFDTPSYDFLDCCGTGGDGLKTLNISTAVAFVLASLGVPVAKHGNRAVSSQSGSTDVLHELGIPFNLSAQQSRHLLDSYNLCFLHAPQYHPGVKHAMPVRHALKIRTVFNLLGPIINPARPSLRLIGLYDSKRLQLVAETLKNLCVKRALVVHGGVDEIAIHGPTHIVELNGQDIKHYQVTPSELGIPTFAINDIAGGDAAFNARALREAMAGKGADAYRAAIAVNAAAGLYLAGKVESLRSGTQWVMSALADGVVAQFFAAYQVEVVRAN